MDRWERRLQLMARAGASGEPGARSSPNREPRVIDARDRLLIPSGTDPVDLIHPDEVSVVRTLLDIALRRPDFHAELTLLTRNRDGWEHYRFEIVHEVMGPVLRLVDEDPTGTEPVTEPEDELETVELEVESGTHPDAATIPASSSAVLERNEVLRHVADVLRVVGDEMVAVLLVDLDRFKVHNDLLGPEGGDEMLRIMCDRIRSAAADHYAGSLGGDEFVVVMDQLSDPAIAQDLAEEVRRTLADPVEVGGEIRNVSATIGLAVGGADTVAEHLVRDADTALFAGKNRGRDRVQVFGRQLGDRVAKQASTAYRLRRALAQGTLELHYQPVVSLETGIVVGAEALMRIHSGREDDEPLSPASLIDAAEDNGLTARLGRYVLEETTSQISLWEHQLAGRQFRVSVNVAPVQLTNRDFSNAIGHALAAAKVSPSRLSLELTESILLAADPVVDSVVQDLVDLGIAFGLDDFGADGSSLGGLRRYPLEFLKIDRELVDAIDTDETVEAIIASTVSLARQLGVSTIAVGVERESQRDVLRRLGCDTAQGYLFFPPLSAAEFAEHL